MQAPNKTGPARHNTPRGESFATGQEDLLGFESSIDLSVKAVGRDMLSDAVQHPTTIVPGFVAALALIGILFFDDFWRWELVLLVTAGATAAGSFGWRYWIRYSKEYARRVQELMDLQDRERRAAEKAELEHLRETLRPLIEYCFSMISGGGSWSCL